jgi:hypothetical protein
MTQILLVRDVLDNQLIDATGKNAGKVDGITMELREGQPPRIAFLEVGPVTLARRLNHRLGDWVARIDAHLGSGRGAPIRIPVSRVVLDEPALRLDLAVINTPIMALEKWLRAKIVRHIPWS